MIAAVDEGSFSAASRKLFRSQSVVSETVSNLEEQIGVPLFDRSGRYPKLTPAGVVLLADARSIMENAKDWLENICGKNGNSLWKSIRRTWRNW